MALVDRYLNAVKFWLPRNQKDDIIAELAEDLRSQIAEKESELGHKISDTDVEPILKRCGSPMAVAGRYLPQQSLIGPALFPIYRVVIRSLFFYFLLPWLVLWVGISIFSSDFRADHPGAALLASLEPWWLACTYSLFFCTLAFALLDRSHLGSQTVNNWNPRALPVERDPNHIPRGATLFELAFAVAMLAVLVQIEPFHRVLHFFGLTATMSPQWPYFIWALTALTGLSIPLSCMHLSQPRWRRVTASFRLGLDVYGWGLMYWVCRANLLQSLSGSDLPSSDAAKLVNSINVGMTSSAIWVLVIGAVVVAFDVRRILRLGTAA